eukprot:scaffold931_cov383-Prasinococcus_capsulatus_cf.AAC.16
MRRARPPLQTAAGRPHLMATRRRRQEEAGSRPSLHLRRPRPPTGATLRTRTRAQCGRPSSSTTTSATASTSASHNPPVRRHLAPWAGGGAPGASREISYLRKDPRRPAGQSYARRRDRIRDQIRSVADGAVGAPVGPKGAAASAARHSSSSSYCCCVLPRAPTSTEVGHVSWDGTARRGTEGGGLESPRQRAGRELLLVDMLAPGH